MNSDQSNSSGQISIFLTNNFILLFLSQFTFVLYLFRYTGSRYVYIPFPPINIATYYYLLIAIAVVAIIAIIYSNIQLPRVVIHLSSLCVLLLVYYITTSLWAPSTGYSTMKTYWVLEVIILYLVALLMSLGGKKYIKIFCLAILIFTITVSLEISYEYIAFGELISPHFTTYYLTISRIIGVSVPVSMFFFFRTNKKWAHMLLISLIYFALIFNLQTGARGPFISTVASILIYGGWIFVFKRNNSTLSLFLIYMSFFLIIGGIVITSTHDINLDTLSRLQILLNGNPGNSASIRIEMYKQSLNLFIESPILGNGIGSFQVLFGSINQYYYPHNIFLEFLVESGLIGFALFIYYILGVIKILLEYGKNNSVYSGVILSLLVFSLFNSLVSGDIPANRRIFIYSAMVFSLVEIE